MADFKTHITTSTVVGIGYGVAGHFYLGAPPTTCALSAGLCSLAGMLPDLDSDTGVPVRETMTFAAAVTPLLMIDRFQHFGWSAEQMVVAGGAIYLAIRFGVAEIFKRYTVHRGMWHSLPAAAIVGLLAFLICSCEDMTLRLFKTGAAVTGFLTHLLLDEFWSFEVKRGKLRVKKSLGTALKLWSRSTWANVSTYGKLLVLIGVAFYDPILMEQFEHAHRHVPETAERWLREGTESLRTE